MVYINNFVLFQCCVCSFIILISSSAVFSEKDKKTITANYDFLNYKAIEYKYTEVTLKCTLEGNGTSHLKLDWYKEEDRIDESDSKYIISGTTGSTELKIKLGDDRNAAGNYSCRVQSNDDVLLAHFKVIYKPYLTLPKDETFHEGGKLELECIVKGDPKPIISWQIGNETYTASSDRIQLLESNGIPNSKLVIEPVELSDRGLYTCEGTNLEGEGKNLTYTSATTTVRVKDKLAALWPFLGICAEVFVLCAIILIYEKKRNKSELEESDTDNSPEQKNTPDHGKESVRQRK